MDYGDLVPVDDFSVVSVFVVLLIHHNPSDFIPRNILQEQMNNSSHDIMPDYKEESSSILQRSRNNQQSSRDERIGI